MSAKKTYSYYETGSTARKFEYVEEKKKVVKKNNKASNKKNAKRKTSSIAVILCMFSMALVLVYRYNVISEKNLESQSLADDLVKVESGLLTAQMEIEQNTDLNQIEAYAKQKLGMQKPDKNQTIYIDTSKTSNSLEVQSDTAFFENITDKISNFFDKIF